jgi:hypothetical protein
VTEVELVATALATALATGAAAGLIDTSRGVVHDLMPRREKQSADGWPVAATACGAVMACGY